MRSFIVIISFIICADMCESRVGRTSRSGARARIRSIASRSALHGSKSSRWNQPNIIGSMQVNSSNDIMCTVNEMMVTTKDHNMYRHLPLCSDKMDINCKVCHGETYNSSKNPGLKYCCHKGLVGRNGKCYLNHVRSIDGFMCNKLYYKLDTYGNCYVAYPIMYIGTTILFVAGMFVFIISLGYIMTMIFS